MRSKGPALQERNSNKTDTRKRPQPNNKLQKLTFKIEDNEPTITPPRKKRRVEKPNMDFKPMQDTFVEIKMGEDVKLDICVLKKETSKKALSSIIPQIQGQRGSSKSKNVSDKSLPAELQPRRGRPHSSKIKRFGIKCTTCEKTLATKQALQIHEKIHLPAAERTKYECRFCDKFFLHKFSLLGHQITHMPEKERNKYSCPYCGKRFLTDRGLHNHQVHGHERKKYPCDGCDKAYRRSPSLLVLEQTHLLKDERKVYTCDKCDKFFYNIAVFQRHERSHLSRGNDKGIPCDLCDKRYRNRSSLNTHKIRIHSTEKVEWKKFKCSTCDKAFEDRANLSFHEITHLPDGEKIHYYCSICNNTYRSEYALATHRRKKHMAGNIYKCRTCYTHFTTSERLQKHIDRGCNTSLEVNGKKGGEECPTCHKLFKSKTMYVRHLKTHLPAEEKETFPCDLCDKKYFQNGSLFTHKKLKHFTPKKEKKKWHNCPSCTKTFEREAALEMHKLTHANTK